MGKKKLRCTTAVADIRGSEEYPNLRGQVRFYQRRDCVLVEANLQGLPHTQTGFFGFHIHRGESCDGEDFADKSLLAA